VCFVLISVASHEIFCTVFVQVASRVQKYFIKLARAGLPVPGRMPNVAAYGGRLSAATIHRHQRYNRFLYPTSTFMTSYEPPVYMSDDDDDITDDAGANMPSNNAENRPTCDDEVGSNDDVIAPCLRDTLEYRQLQALIAVRQQRRRSNSENSLDGQNGAHVFAGDERSCKIKSEPVLEDSAISELPRSAYLDPDYASSTIGISSYLDPNYMPSV
jgi:hypothetical protein